MAKINLSTNLRLTNKNKNCISWTYKLLVLYLKKNNAQFPTEDKPIRVIIKTIHPFTYINNIKKRLTGPSFDVKQVTNIIYIKQLTLHYPYSLWIYKTLKKNHWKCINYLLYCVRKSKLRNIINIDCSIIISVPWNTTPKSEGSQNLGSK